MTTIDDFIGYVTKLSGKRILRGCQGATAESIAEYVSLVPYRLPELYLGYLRHFGVNDGALRLWGEANGQLDRLKTFWRAEQREGFPHVPPHCVPTALSGLVGDLSLCYANGADNPTVVRHWAESIDFTKSSSFTNALFAAAFMAAWRELPGTGEVVLYSDALGSRVLFAQIVLGAGFTPQWFGDEFDGFFTRGSDLVRITDETARVVVLLRVIGWDRREELIGVLRGAVPCLRVE